ncbi:MAG: lipopolysaccharide assembly LapA domain-containing protein [Fluviibacter sp.]
MRAIVWLIRIVVFVLFLAFAIENTEPVVINLFLGYYLEAPLVLFLLGALLIGLFLGMLMLVPNLLRKRRELAKLRREAQQRVGRNALPAESEAHATPTL